MKTETKQKIVEYVKWDYGIDLIKIYNKIQEILHGKIVKNILTFFAILGVFIAGGMSAGVLSLLFFAYPICVAVLIVLYIWMMVIVYYYYNNRLDEVIETIRRKINAKKEN